MTDRIKSSARPYLRPLIVTFSALTLASLFSFAAIELTEPTLEKASEAATTTHARILPATKSPAESNTAKPAEESTETSQYKHYLEICVKAEAGDAEAMLERSMVHLLGIGTSIDRAMAMKWLRLSAENGNVQAQFSYAQSCLRGEYLAKDIPEAIRWFRLAAAKQNADAELSLAQLYLHGVGLPADKNESVRWLKLSATHGHPIAQADYAFVVLEENKPETYAECAEWLRKSALQGKPSSMFNLAIMYQRGMGVPKDMITALAWYMVSAYDGDEEIVEEVGKVLAGITPADRRKALERTKPIIASLNISPIYSQGSRRIDLANAFHEQFARAATGGAEDEYELARLFHEGIGTINDPAEAALWCRKAAVQGHVDAMRTLAQCLKEGDGVERNLVEMAKWFHKAADADDQRSMFQLSLCYKEGAGVEKDDKQAEFWTKKAADKGHPIAQANMGAAIMLENDKRRFPEAVRWFKLSAKQGHPGGMYKYGLALFLGMGVKEDRIEGSAWAIACLPMADDESLKQAIKNTVEELTPGERKRAEVIAAEIAKLF